MSSSDSSSSNGSTNSSSFEDSSNYPELKASLLMLCLGSVIALPLTGLAEGEGRNCLDAEGARGDSVVFVVTPPLLSLLEESTFCSEVSSQRSILRPGGPLHFDNGMSMVLRPASSKQGSTDSAT